MIIHDFGRYSFTYDLAKNIQKKGMGVEYMYCRGHDGPNAQSLEASISDVKLTSVSGLIKYKRGNFFRRALFEVFYGFNLSLAIMRAGRGHCLLANTPLISSCIVIIMSASRPVQITWWVQDVHYLAISNFIGRKSRFLTSLLKIILREIERGFIEKCWSYISISEKFIDELGLKNNNIVSGIILPNWAPIEEIKLCNKQNNWSNGKVNASRFCVMYTGTLGIKHDLKSVIDLYNNLCSESTLILVSSRESIERVRSVLDSSLTDREVVCFPFQAFEDYDKMLGAADVLIATLSTDAAAYSVPSKILSYMCAGRPIILFCDDLNNDAAILIRQVGCGFVFTASDLPGLKSILNKLRGDKSYASSLGMKGRLFAEENFDGSRIATRILNHLGLGIGNQNE